MTVAVVTNTDLGSDFDVGSQVADKLNVVAATTDVAGKVKLSTSAMGVAGVDTATAMTPAATAAAISALAPGGGGGSLTLSALTTLIASLPTTLPGTSGVLWLNGGVLQLS